MVTLEEKLFKDIENKKFDLTEALLMASGVDNEIELSGYKLKLKELHQRFKLYVNEYKTSLGINFKNKVVLAKLIHDFLWKRENRYNNNFKLTDAIDTQLSLDERGVGNCVALTSLYNLLCSDYKLDTSVLISKTHVLTRLNLDETGYINIENTEKDGFCVRTPKDCEKSDNSLLISLIYFSRGLDLFKQDKREEAIKMYDRAILIDPNDAFKYYDRGLCFCSLNLYREALNDLEKAIQLNNKAACFYFMRGFCLQQFKGPKAAIDDYAKAIVMDREKYEKKVRDNLGLDEDYKVLP